MHVIKARNVNGALCDAMYRLRTNGFEEDSRNGPVVKLDAPLCVTYTRPQERVLFDFMRDANPFFHFFESLWMLAGHNDVEFLEQFVPRMRDYSDDGATLSGAYGYRWRHHFEMDQIIYVIRLLQEHPTTRRAVIAMWDPQTDLVLDEDSKDLPCNTTIMFQYSNHQLDMMVTNRSNDVIWGLCGANAVHMSFLHEYVARSVGMPLGHYHQVTFNAHAYLTEQYHRMAVAPYSDDRYMKAVTIPLPLPSAIDQFNADLYKFMSDPSGEPAFYTEFFNHYATNMWDAFQAHKRGFADAALSCISAMPDCDWKVACGEWLLRRKK